MASGDGAGGGEELSLLPRREAGASGGTAAPQGPVAPSSLLGYLKSVGPGLVMALTWLGAGDLVDSAVAGGSYGYALTWAMALAFCVRFVFVSLLAKFQLCNRRGESVVAGIARLHPALAVAVGFIAVVFGHANNSYMIRGIGETTAALLPLGAPAFWSVAWMAAMTLFLFRGGRQWRSVEKLFYFFLMLLSTSLLGVAAWSGPDFAAMARGLFLFDLPPDANGEFSVLLVVVSLIGAIGGSIANMMYPFFVQEKGWRGPEFRTAQMYDLAFGTCAVVLLDLAVWTIGAEVLHPARLSVDGLEGLASLLTLTLGPGGGPIFYLGALVALLSSVMGNASGYGLLIAEVARVTRSQQGSAGADAVPPSSTRAWQATALWCLWSPIVWSLPNMPMDFVALTVLVNAMNVVVLPFLTLVVWVLTSRAESIGADYTNRWWEHGVMCGLFALAVWGATQSLRSLSAHAS